MHVGECRGGRFGEGESLAPHGQLDVSELRAGDGHARAANTGRVGLEASGEQRARVRVPDVDAL